MDTVHEENSPPPSPDHDTAHNGFFPPTPSLLAPPPPVHSSHVPQISINDIQTSLSRVVPDQSVDSTNNSRSSSRRASVIIQALRRPSQSVALSAAHAVMNQRRYIMGLFNDAGDPSQKDLDPKELQKLQLNREVGEDALSIILSAFYAKLLVVLGMAFPVIEVITSEKEFYYQWFYIYLYFGSILFVSYIYATVYKEKALVDMIKGYTLKRNKSRKSLKETPKYGSFYLRLGAIAFGIGSMVYSGLEFGRYFELTNNPECNSNVLQAVTPIGRMVLTLFQFIFLNSKDIDYNKHKLVARFGIMHMIATNLSEWLYVLIEETKHEIHHLAEHRNAGNVSSHENLCQDGLVMGSLIANASPFLFPCTIEYSLICAVILFEIWKEIKMAEKEKDEDKDKTMRAGVGPAKPAGTHLQFNQYGAKVVNSNHHFTIDCSNAHKGLFGGILVIVLTIISLIMFFVLANAKKDSEKIAIFEVNIVELVLYVITTIAVIIAMIQMRHLKYDRKTGHDSESTGIGLDCILLVVAQTGMFIYCVFSIIGCCFIHDDNNSVELATEIFSFIQTCIQTIFVLDAWWRRCKSIQQIRTKPGKELITFLIVANMAMWTISTLEKNRAEFRPSHLEFFGDWAWTIITHVSMPLAIFYRFHSTICLFEIWKTAYKIKAKYNAEMFPLM